MVQFFDGARKIEKVPDLARLSETITTYERNKARRLTSSAIRAAKKSRLSIFRCSA